MVTSCSGQCFVKQRSTTCGDFSSGSNFVTLYFSHFLSLLVLIVWALYNKLRFQKQQHHAAYQYTPQEYAESLAIPDELYQQLQKSHRMSVHFTSQGQIKMVVSEKALVRA